MNRPTLRGKIDSLDPRLSPRESRAIHLYNQGLTYTVVAERLSISIGGVKSHITSARKKVGLPPCTKS